MVLLASFSVKEGVKQEKRGFQPMRKKLGQKFDMVFSLTVVVMDTELLAYWVLFHASGCSSLGFPPVHCQVFWERYLGKGVKGGGFRGG